MSEERTLSAKAEVQRLLAGKCSLGPQEEWQNENVYRFHDLNKACVKDSFPLPRIDASVDKATGCQRFSQLDCFSGYHQIWLKKEDEGKTSFTTPFGTYCYTRMPGQPSLES